MTTPFQKLRDQLREAGCQMQCAEQVKTSLGLFELWLVYPREPGVPTRIMVFDEGSKGYQLFIENRTNQIDDDVAAILGILTTDIA